MRGSGKVHVAALLAATLVVAAAVAACGDEQADPAPVANAGFDQVVRVASTVSLSAAQSYDPAGRALGYTWQLLEKPEQSLTAVVGRESATASFVTDREGYYLLSLVVSAGGERSQPDLVSVLARNQPPVAMAQCIPTSCAVLHGRSVQLDARQSFDPDEDVITDSFVWAQVTDCAACPELTPCVADPTRVTLAAGAYPGLVSFTAPEAAGITLVFAVSVSDGVDSASTCIGVQVTNTPPRVVVPRTAGYNPTQVNEGDLFTLSGSGSNDYDGDPITYRWAQTAGPAATMQTPLASNNIVTAPAVTADTTLTFTLTISDGLATDSESVDVLVRNL